MLRVRRRRTAAAKHVTMQTIDKTVIITNG
jgi:hypothetical protein